MKKNETQISRSLPMRSLAAVCRAVLVCLCGFGTAATLAAASCPRTMVKFSEILYWPTNDQPQWVELFNTGTESVDARGMEIVSGTNAYSLPLDLEEVPTNAFILVYFDGGGSNDLSFAGDNLAVLHSTTTNFLGNPAGAVSLYQVSGIHTPDTLADFVAWGGEPGAEAQVAVTKGLWSATNDFIATQNTPDAGPAGAFAPAAPGGTLDFVAGGWTVYGPGQATPGTLNALITAPYLDEPSDGEWFDAAPDWFRWAPQPGAGRYELQVASDAGFTNLSVDVSNLVANLYFPPSTNTVPNGTNWCRVRAFTAGGMSSDWSAVRHFIVGLPTNTVPPAPVFKMPNASPKAGTVLIQGAVVDTRTGHGLGNVSVSLMAGAGVVDSDTTDPSGQFLLLATNGSYSIVGKLANYTVASLPVTVSASVAGLVVHATGNSGSATVVPLGAQKDSPLLQTAHSTKDGRMCEKDNSHDQAWDQVHAHPHPEGGSLECWYCWAVSATMIGRHAGGTVLIDEVVNDVKSLAFGSDCGALPADEKKALRFTLQTTDDKLNYTFTKFTESQVRDAITNNRPIYFVEPGHVMTLDAFQYRDGQMWCQFVNTDNRGSTQYRNYASQAWWRGACPVAGLSGRPVDTRIKSGASFVDSDGDGVLDFDEVTRFNSDKSKTDTDDDGIADKTEIASWAFPRDGVGGNIAGKPFAPAWGKKAQYTADTDAGGINDGDEDKNHNGISGKWDTANPGETDVFDPSDDKRSLDLVFCIDTTGSMGDDIAQVKANAVTIIQNLTNFFTAPRIALVGYKDFPEEDSVYLYRDFATFTTNTSTVISAINGLSVSGGGDTPEAVYSALIHSLDGGTLGGWRTNPVKRAIIIMCDAPPHDPEPHTGYTLLDVIAKSITGGVTVGSGYTPSVLTGDGPSVKAADASTSAGLSGAIPIYPVWVSSDYEAGYYLTNIAKGTGGAIVHATSSSDVPAQMLKQIETIEASTAASLAVSGSKGQTDVRGLTNIIADASASYDPNGCGILKYEWDWNGDGVYDEMTLDPVVPHDYPDGFDGSITVRITTVGGDTATATYALAPVVPSNVSILSQMLGTNIDLQTGLYYGQVVVSNAGSATINGLRISATNLPDGVSFVSATGTNAGVPYVDFGNSLAAGETLTLNLAFYSTDRQVPTGTGVSVAPVTYSAPTPATGDVVAINRSYMRPDGNMAIDFNTASGRVYVIEYSSDMETWKQAQPPVTGNGTTMIWVDSGPPETESPPSTARYYRLLLLPQ